MNAKAAPVPQKTKIPVYSAFAFCLLLGLLPIVGMIVPRFIAFFPFLLVLTGFFVTAGSFTAVTKNISKVYWVPVVAFLLLATSSSLWAIDQGQTFKRTMKLLPVLLPVIFLPGIIKTIPPQALKKYMAFFPVAFVVALIVASVELYFDAPLYQLIRGKTEDAVFNLSQINRGITTLVMAFFLAFPFILRVPMRSVQKGVFLGAVATLWLLILYKTDSQSAQLAFVVGFLFMVGFPYRCKAAWVALFALMAALIMSAPWLVQYMFKEFAGGAQNVDWLQHAYAADRLEIWDSVARYALHHPFYGFGLEATRAVDAFETAQIYRKSVTVLHPHNFALQFWIEFGVIGAALGSAFIGFILNRLSKLPVEEARLALPTMMAFMTVCATGYGLWQGWWAGLAVILFACILTVRQGLALFYDRRA